jgi:3-oxoacyl-[acyl-carrier protein] reductase
MGQLQDKVTLITGVGRGQGLAAARRFATEGARLVINDIDTQSVTAAVETIRAAGGEAVGAVGDVSKTTDVQQVLAVAKDKWGGLDILYNNAGSATRRRSASAWR